MSKSLVKKALILAEEGLNCSEREKNKEEKHNRMSSHQASLKKVGKRRHNISKEVSKQRGNFTIMEARKMLQSRKDNTEDNIRKLLLLSSTGVEKNASAKLVKRAQTGRYVVEAKEFMTQQGQEQGVFSEEDFTAFEKELERIS
ncbi:uncharacterized protein LOC131428234 [Malaya genurostris]|uniref:uncharacterized protein LOC131428234 n=1 Tax=Malaya genurostris TaxID=325434 RepID=UPI0026F3B674|nr:uncharacterized protein LOC131428234 [Malaya genurostris]